MTNEQIINDLRNKVLVCKGLDGRVDHIEIEPLLYEEVVALLQECMPVEPVCICKGPKVYSSIYHCGNCNAFITWKQRYCQDCGWKVKWK